MTDGWDDDADDDPDVLADAFAFALTDAVEFAGADGFADESRLAGAVPGLLSVAFCANAGARRHRVIEPVRQVATARELNVPLPTKNFLSILPRIQ